MKNKRNYPNTTPARLNHKGYVAEFQNVSAVANESNTKQDAYPSDRTYISFSFAQLDNIFPHSNAL